MRKSGKDGLGIEMNKEWVDKFNEGKKGKVLSFQIEDDQYKLVKTRETVFKEGTKLVKIVFYKNGKVEGTGWYNTERELMTDVDLQAIVWDFTLKLKHPEEYTKTAPTFTIKKVFRPKLTLTVLKND